MTLKPDINSLESEYIPLILTSKAFILPNDTRYLYHKNKYPQHIGILSNLLNKLKDKPNFEDFLDLFSEQIGLYNNDHKTIKVYIPKNLDSYYDKTIYIFDLIYNNIN